MPPSAASPAQAVSAIAIGEIVRIGHASRAERSPVEADHPREAAGGVPRSGFEEHRVDQREHRGGSANADGERQHDDQRPARLTSHAADGMPDIATRVIETGPSPDIEGLLAKLQGIAEPHTRPARRVSVGHSVAFVDRFAQLQV